MAVDLAVVGAGIVGCAFAHAAASRGLTVRVLERTAYARGASVRNFGMVWPIGQPAGTQYQLAMSSRAVWLELARRADFEARQSGSLHLVRHEDELAVVTEFATTAASDGVECEVISPEAAVARSPGVRPEGLLGALYSPAELAVDPREVLGTLPVYLHDVLGVEFQFNTAVTRVEPGVLTTASGERVEFGRCVVATGADFAHLLPGVFADSGLVPCRLHMMRTGPQPNGWELGPHLAAGLTLTHYQGFAGCPSLAALKARIACRMPAYVANGIHVMASQNGFGELVLGDSHHYGDAITPFENPLVEEMILKYLWEFATCPRPGVVARWTGVYAKHPSLPYFAANPMPTVEVVTGLGGAGMTLAFGLAEQLFAAGVSA